jgi:hypothetical protein
MLQMLAWLARRPRTYGEAMDAWRTSCPRFSIWEDALADHLILVSRANGSVGEGRPVVALTTEGRALLDRLRTALVRMVDNVSCRRTDNHSRTAASWVGQNESPTTAVGQEDRVNDDEMAARIREVFEFGDMEAFAKAQYEMSAEDVVNEFPQSGERFRGRDKIAAMNQSYSGKTGTAPKTTLRRIIKPGEAWVIEATIDYGDGTPVSGISIIETGPDGKVVKQTDYFANPFEAPEWRRQYAERMEPASAG